MSQVRDARRKEYEPLQGQDQVGFFNPLVPGGAKNKNPQFNFKSTFNC